MSFARRAPVLAAALVAHLLVSACPSRADEGGNLTVCLDRANPPSASGSSGEAGGFDLAMARALARRMDRTLAVQWYESSTDGDDNPALQINALLSDGRCQLVLGYPLFADAVGRPGAERSRLPGYAGALPADRRRWVKLEELVAGRAYRYDPLVVVLASRARSREIRSLADLAPLRIVSEERTLADAVLMLYGGGTLVARITHVTPGGDVFGSMERGDEDATLVELHRFDAYRVQHPSTELTLSGHQHSIGFNVGSIGLASEAPLMAQVDAAVGEMLASGELPTLARDAGITFLPPREPNVAGTLTPAALRGD